MGRRVTRAHLVAVALLSVLGCVPSRSPKPATEVVSATIADPELTMVLERACFACHAAASRRPWYAHLAPSSWTSAARRDVDFSAWQTYDAERRRQALGAIAMTVQSGAMPPRDYTFFDGGAKLTERERDALVRWASRQDAPTGVAPADTP